MDYLLISELLVTRIVEGFNRKRHSVGWWIRWLLLQAALRGFMDGCFDQRGIVVTTILFLERYVFVFNQYCMGFSILRYWWYASFTSATCNTAYTCMRRRVKREHCYSACYPPNSALHPTNSKGAQFIGSSRNIQKVALTRLGSGKLFCCVWRKLMVVCTAYCFDLSLFVSH